MDVLSEYGLGASLRRGDYTEAAHRAIRDALWRQSINAAELFGCQKEDMRVRVRIGVQNPDAVALDPLKAIFPYGQVDLSVGFGGLDVPRPDGQDGATVMATCVITVALAGVSTEAALDSGLPVAPDGQA